jgi:acyl-CoA thioester hydrolase
MKYRDFSHHTPLQIRFADIDRLNHVNNAVYHSFFELGRVNYFKDVLQHDINWDNEGFILAHTEINHLLPLYLNDKVHCFTRVTRLGNKSLTIENIVVKESGKDLIVSAAGQGVLVAMDYQNNLSVPIPELWRNRIRAFEKI